MTNPLGQTAGRLFDALMHRPYLVLTLTTLFWGGNVVAGKLAVGHIDPHVLMILRWSGALLAVLPFAIRPLKRDWPTIRGNLPLLLFYGVVGYATFNVLVYLAAHLTSGVNIAMEQVAVNIFVMILNFAIFRTHVRALQLLGVALTILGVAITATHGDLSRILTLDVNLGDALVLLACLAYAVYSLTLRYRPATNWLSFLVVTFVGAIIASFLFQFLLGGGPAQLAIAFGQITWQGWLIALYTVFFPSVISQMLYVRGVELIGPNRASLFINLIPFFGTVGSVLLLGESLETSHLVAAALIVVGIVLAEWSARRG
jgi:drug/metabolite transporter (DMT)-like permease